MYFDGYWQSERYFSHIAEEIRHEFTLRDPFSGDAAMLAAAMRGEESVSLHVRRGDYVLSEKTNEFHGTCSPDYYAAALRLVKDRVSHPRLYVFSDDIEWVASEMSFDVPAVLVSRYGLRDHEEMALMATRRHHILANSSFSWWGAWLGDADNAVNVAPRKWFNASLDTSDLVPIRWTRL